MDDLKLTYFGGIKKKTYWAPDGREILAIPAMRTFINRKTNETGVRDANYDNGWLDAPPENPKPHCDGCGRWHDTQEEVEGCISRRRKSSKKWDAQAQKELRAKDSEIEKVNKRVDGIEETLKQILTILKEK